MSTEPVHDDLSRSISLCRNRIVCVPTAPSMPTVPLRALSVMKFVHAPQMNGGGPQSNRVDGRSEFRGAGSGAGLAIRSVDQSLGQWICVASTITFPVAMGRLPCR